jgi:hypothetical protein
MSKVNGKCSACGAVIELDVAPPFAGAQLAAPLCAACTDLQFQAGGGAILELRNEPQGGRFPLGRVTITGGAIKALGAIGEHAASFLARHARGDWGVNGQFEQIELTADERRRGWEATDDSGKVNKSNVLGRRDRVISDYQTAGGKRLWIITCLDHGGGTTVLLPEEY